MKTFPSTKIDQAAYERELARHLHDDFNYRCTHVLWLGTEDMQREIERGGFENYRSDLCQIRYSIRQHWLQIDLLKAQVREQDARATDFQRKTKEGDFRRDSTTRRLVRIDRSELERGMHSARQAGDAAAIKSKRAEESLRQLQNVEERLTAALVMYLSRDQLRQDNPPAPVPQPAPVVNVKVEAPVVNLEATIEVPPIRIGEMAITSMPSRKTESTVERDQAGNIKRTTQIETDA